MYFISVILFLIIAVFFSLNTYGATVPFDFVSWLSILLFTVPIIMACGLGKDFFAGFAFSMKKTCCADKIELLRAHTAVSLCRRLLLLSGILSTLLSFFSLLRNLDDPALIGPNVNVAILALVYAILANIMLLPVQIRLQLLADNCA